MVTPSLPAGAGPAHAPAPAPHGAPPPAPARPTPRAPAVPCPSGPITVTLDPEVFAAGARTIGSARRGRARGAVPGWAKAPPAAPRPKAAKASGTAATASKASDLSFLSDPRLSIEEKLMRLLAHLNARWEKEMEAKLKKLAGEGGTASASGTKKKKSGGLLGAVAGAAAGVLGGGAAGAVFDALKIPGVRSALGKIGGPVLAAAASALGFPAAAPLLLKLGPSIVDAATAVAGAARSAGGTSSSSAAKAPSDGERQLVMMEIQRLQEKQKEMFGLVSNVLRSNHDARMVAIGNIR